MRKAIGKEGAWFETDIAQSWELPLSQTLWRTATGVWVLEAKRTTSRRYSINAVPEHQALALFTKHELQIPSDFLDDSNQI